MRSGIAHAGTHHHAPVHEDGLGWQPWRSSPTASILSLTTNTSASAIEAASTFPERDDVLIEDAGYFIAGSGFTDGAPDNPTTLTWVDSRTTLVGIETPGTGR